MKKYVLILFISFAISVVLLKIFIPILKKIKVKQPIYVYVENHKDKSGTPTMGGICFVVPSIVVSLCFISFSNIAFMILAITFAFLLVGFLDDYLKIRLKHNEGLKPYQKIIFQFSIAVLSGYFCCKNELTRFVLPFSKLDINLGAYTILIVVFIFLAITNSVNLTDGIDGLASSVSIVYLLFLSLIIFFEFNLELQTEINYNNFLIISFSFLGGLLAFLFFNINKAKIFMGDTGSLALGGLIGAISIFSFNSFFIPIIGIMFVVSSITVIVQVIYFKRTKKRIFLMTPFHHHLQLKGLSECKICYIYSFVTFVFGVLSILTFL